MGGPGQSVISIVDADPDLADLLDARGVERARHEALTRVQRLSPGEWDAAAAQEPAEHHRGFLIVDGLLSRTVEVLGRRCVELVGHGDVMRPWRWDDEGSHVRAEIGWTVLEPSRLAILDHDLVLRMVPWPQLGLELFNRGTRRAHHLAVALAIAHHQRVEDRLLLTLWHLAERWGRVHPTASSSRCRSAISGWPTSSAPSASPSPPRWASSPARGRSAAVATAIGCSTATRRPSCGITSWWPP